MSGEGFDFEKARKAEFRPGSRHMLFRGIGAAAAIVVLFGAGELFYRNSDASHSVTVPNHNQPRLESYGPVGCRGTGEQLMTVDRSERDQYGDIDVAELVPKLKSIIEYGGICNPAGLIEDIDHLNSNQALVDGNLVTKGLSKNDSGNYYINIPKEVTYNGTN